MKGQPTSSTALMSCVKVSHLIYTQVGSNIVAAYDEDILSLHWKLRKRLLQSIGDLKLVAVTETSK